MAAFPAWCLWHLSADRDLCCDAAMCYPEKFTQHDLLRLGWFLQWLYSTEMEVVSDNCFCLPYQIRQVMSVKTGTVGFLKNNQCSGKSVPSRKR